MRPTEPADAPGSWTPTGELPVGAVFWPGQDEGPRPLPDGGALAAGGTAPGPRALAEAAVFRPATGTWTAAAPLARARTLHTLTGLADGRILAAGGTSEPGVYPPPALASAEVFDPGSGSWAPVADLGEPRCGHSATRLPDGRVLVAGGEQPRSADSSRTLASAEVFDPADGTWTPVRPMTDPRWHHPAVPLPGGRVLVAGGLVTTGPRTTASLALCEVYDPSTGQWAPAGTLGVTRFAHQAVALQDGSVLAIGGGTPRVADDARFEPHSLATVERYDPASGVWHEAPPLASGRAHHRAVPLATGEVLVVGGADSITLNAGFPTAARYSPAADAWSPAAPLRTGRWGFGATVLPDGRVLVAGGATRGAAAAPDTGADVPALMTEAFTP